MKKTLTVALVQQGCAGPRNANLAESVKHIRHAKLVPNTNEPSYSSNSVALSFAFDVATKSLNVVMTDKASGEVVRKMSYTHLPTEVHQANKLHGLLLDQFA